jgi:hypothetical protein
VTTGVNRCAGSWLGMRPRASVAILVVFLVAGCLGPSDEGPPTASPGPSEPVPADWAERALPFGAQHAHSDPAQHEGLSTPNFEVLGWDPMINDYHKANAGGHYCGDVGVNAKGKYAVVNGFTSDVALVVMDVTDPGHPTKAGELVLTRTHVYDAAMVPDASFVILATSPLDTGPDTPPLRNPIRAEWTDACGQTHVGPEQDAPYASGVVLVDLSDPRSPRVADYVAQPVIGAHSVFATLLDGQRWVLASTTNLVHQVSYFSFFTVESLPALGPRLQAQGTYDAQYPGQNSASAPLSNGHVDGWIQKHPITKANLAYLANWDGGLTILRIDGPGRFTVVGTWNDLDQSKGSEMTGQIHDALPIEGTWEGKHYTFVGQEIVNHPAKRPTGQVVRLDTTDPANPKPTGRWTLPVDVEWSQTLIFSTHYIELIERTLLVSLYHGGVWAADADPSQGPELPTLGVFVPDRVPPEVRVGARGDPAPEVLDVLGQADGSFVSFDARGGIYVLRFHPENRMPPLEPWTADAWIK